MKVLIIEQEKTMQQSLLFFIESLDACEAFLAGSEKEGISLFASIHFDIVLCGDRLPDGDGLEVVKKLMKQNPKLISILMTARGDELLRQEAMNAGIQGYLEKPFDLRQLEEALCTSDAECRMKREMVQPELKTALR
jgi:DNA-binding response OmpR family regulator